MRFAFTIREALYITRNERLAGSVRTDSDPPFDFHGRSVRDWGGGGGGGGFMRPRAIVNLG